MNKTLSQAEELQVIIERVIKKESGYNCGSLVQLSLKYQTQVGGTFEDWLILYDIYKVVLFNHDFAKAYFGENSHKIIIDGLHGFNYMMGTEWQYRLQQAVIS